MELGSDAFFLLFHNICPQSERLNNGTWRGLEERCRTWAEKFGRVYIVCGPIFSSDPQTIGKNKVCVPVRFFKAVLLPVGGGYKCAGYLFTNDEVVKKRVMTVDELEDIACMDFFPALENDVEKRVEAELDRNIFK